MNNSAETQNFAAKAFACALLISRAPPKTCEIVPDELKISAKSFCFNPCCFIRNVRTSRGVEDLPTGG